MEINKILFSPATASEFKLGMYSMSIISYLFSCSLSVASHFNFPELQILRNPSLANVAILQAPPDSLKGIILEIYPKCACSTKQLGVDPQGNVQAIFASYSENSVLVLVFMNALRQNSFRFISISKVISLFSMFQHLYKRWHFNGVGSVCFT